MAFQIKQNDRRPFFVVVLKDEFEEPGESVVDLTTAVSAAFSMRPVGGGPVKISLAPATITNAAGGEVTYQWAALDLDEVGDYEAEVVITWSGGLVETFPNNGYFDISVVDDIV